MAKEEYSERSLKYILAIAIVIAITVVALVVGYVMMQPVTFDATVKIDPLQFGASNSESEFGANITGGTLEVHGTAPSFVVITVIENMMWTKR